MEHPKIIQKISKRNLSLAGIIAVVGLASLIFGLQSSIELTFARFTVPPILFVILGLVIILVAIVWGLIGLKSEHCAECKSELTSEQARFEFEAQKTVLEAISKKEVTLLTSLSMAEDPGNEIEIDFNYCKKCHNIGQVEVNRREEWNPDNLLPEENVDNKDFIKSLGKITEEQEKLREEMEDDE